MTLDSIANPTVLELQQECLRLKSVLTECITKREFLTNVAIPRIRNAYNSRFGKLIFALLQKEYEVRAMKRRIKLLEDAAAAKETVFPNAIEREIQNEYREFIDEMSEQELKNDVAEIFAGISTLSSEDENKLLSLFRKLIGKIHPEITDELSPMQEESWQNASSAFRSSDLTRMHELEEYVDRKIVQKKNAANLSFEELKLLRSKLLTKTETVIAQIKKIEQEDEFELEARLQNSDWCGSHRADLREQIAEHQKTVNELNKRFDALLRQVDVAEMQCGEELEWDDIIE